VSDGKSSTETQTSLSVDAAPVAGGGLTFEAESVTPTLPFVASGGAISQPSLTTLLGGGLAVYGFTITNAGSYVIQAVVNAADTSANSFFVNIDGEPTDPASIWQIPLTSGFESRIVSWQGAGTFDNPQFVPKIFTLTTGNHQLIIRGREANTQLDRISILKLPAPPSNLRAVSGT
jgi:hypothetical protein